MEKQIIIPEKYWLKVKNFDFTKFNKLDIKYIYLSPNSLIEDFENVPGFKNYVQKLNIKIPVKNKNKKISKNNKYNLNCLKNKISEIKTNIY